MSVASPPAEHGRLRPPAGSLRPLLLLGLGALELPRCCQAKKEREPRFSNVFQSSMVLQRNRPIAVWGFDAMYGETLDVMLDSSHGVEVSWTEAIAGKNGEWRAVLSTPAPNMVGTRLRLALTRRGAQSPAQVLDDVVLGDVYLFSGQSNVDLPVSYVHQFSSEGEEREEQSADEIGASGLLRLMIVPARCGLTYHDSKLAREFADVQECLPCPPPFSKTASLSDVNSCNLLGGKHFNYTYCNCDSLFWTRPNGANVRGFSAAAWFFGKALLEMGAAKGVPIGLIRSSWGATNIAVWSGVDALAKCPQEGDVPTSFAPYTKSALWGHMIYPLKGLQLSAAVWVHGARNIGGVKPYMGGTYYSCALRAMITDWRVQLEQANLPFLVVESPVYCNELDYRTWHTWCDDRHTKLRFPDAHLPEIRMAQNQAEALPHVYLVSVMDQGSLKKVMGGAIHSERKPELGRRLALAARAAVYQDPQAVWSGPTASFAWQSGRHEVSVCFDTRGGGRLVVNESAICPVVVLPVYCTGATFELLSSGVWHSPGSVQAHGSIVRLTMPPEVRSIERVRYAWADWPVCSILSEAGMPARLFDLPVHSREDEPVCAQDGSVDMVGSRYGSKAPFLMPSRHAKSVPAEGPLRNPQAMRFIAILGSMLVSFPMLAVAAVAARWGLREHGWVVKHLEGILDRWFRDRSATDQSSDYQAPLKNGSGSSVSSPSSPRGGAMSAGRLNPAKQSASKSSSGRPTPLAQSPRTSSRSMRREPPATNAASQNSQRSVRRDRSNPNSPRNSSSAPAAASSPNSPRSGSGSKRVVRSQSEEAPLIQKIGQKEQKEPAKSRLRMPSFSKSGTK